MKSRINLLSLLPFLTFLLFACASKAQFGLPIHTEDSIINYYSNNKISVIITPWQDGRREVQLYNLKGEMTYRMEEARMSYQASVDLAFHSNGAVKAANIFTNPGASLYMISETIEFSTTNEPQWRLSKKHPVRKLEDAAGTKYYWNKHEKQWKRQEIAECQPVPSK